MGCEDLKITKNDSKKKKKKMLQWPKNCKKNDIDIAIDIMQ